MAADGYTQAGKVDLQELTLFSADGMHTSMLPYLIEINIHEDIYSSGLYGNIVVLDSIGLINRLTMTGDEYLTIKYDVPGFENPIHKTFRCYRITDRTFKNDNSNETYIIHFVSPEVMLDQLSVVQKSFSGPTNDVIEDIFRNYIMTPRTLSISDNGGVVASEEVTELNLFTDVQRKIKFISPSWSPFHCINWVAAKTLPESSSLNAPNMMFFETTRRFYWASLEDLIRTQYEAQVLSGKYVYAPGNVKVDTTGEVMVDERIFHAPDLPRDFFSIHHIEISNNVDALSNVQHGYLASVYHELDIGTRTYKELPYDHADEFSKQFRTAGNKAIGFFSDGSLRNPYNHQVVGFKHPGLFTGIKDNLNEYASTTLPKRLSQLQDVEQVKVKIDVFGRTDMEVGSLIYILYPKSGPRDEEDKNKSIQDRFYSGIYVTTAIHHRINLETYHMTMEAVKDSWGDVSDGDAAK